MKYKSWLNKTNTPCPHKNGSSALWWGKWSRYVTQNGNIASSEGRNTNELVAWYREFIIVKRYYCYAICSHCVDICWSCQHTCVTNNPPLFFYLVQTLYVGSYNCISYKCLVCYSRYTLNHHNISEERIFETDSCWTYCNYEIWLKFWNATVHHQISELHCSLLFRVLQIPVFNNIYFT